MEKIFIKNRHNQKIVVVVNKHNNTKGLAFVMHGLGGFKEQPHIQLLAHTFQEAGLTAILFDTTNSIGESDGKYEDATMQNYYEDLEDVISWSKSQPWYQEPYILAGHSLGGYSVIRFAEENPIKVKAIFAWAPVVSGQLSYQVTEEYGEVADWQQTGWKIRASSSKPGLVLRLPWSHMLERQNHNLLPKANQLTMPILIITGDQDIPCPPAHQKILFEAIPSTKKQLNIIKDGPHTFREYKHLEELKRILNSWIQKLT
jgi:alpha-beta hydrolase superfamily lysophospholipase